MFHFEISKLCVIEGGDQYFMHYEIMFIQLLDLVIKYMFTGQTDGG